MLHHYLKNQDQRRFVQVCFGPIHSKNAIHSQNAVHSKNTIHSKNIKNIVENVVDNVENVVITGGEPLMWNMDLLTKALKSKNKKTHLETSGAYKISGIWDWFCLSPKKK